MQGPDSPRILCHRPPGAMSIPVTLMHPVFGRFVDNCKESKTTHEDHEFVLNLSHAMSGFFNKEDDRADMFRQHLRQYCNVTFATKIRATNMQTDGYLETNGFFYVNTEAKNEIGQGGADPLIQSTIYYINFVREQVNQYSWSSLPCLHVYYAGMLCISISI